MQTFGNRCVRLTRSGSGSIAPHARKIFQARRGAQRSADERGHQRIDIASAAAVRVGQALGRKDPAGAADAGGTAIFVGAAFMLAASVLLLVFPRAIARMYTPDEAVIHTTIILLAAGAAFQLFDGIQTVATGALRGAGDTRTPMLCHFTAYWIIGLPLGAWLCFRRGWGAFGIWAGLSLALILIGIVLLLAWRRTVHKLTQLASQNRHLVNSPAGSV